jgi:hypothetical protein
LSIENAANDVVTNARKIFYPATADENNRVLLEVVTDSRNVRRNFVTIREANTGNFTEGRVRLLWSCRVNACANSATLRAARESRRLGLALLNSALLADQLIDRRHSDEPLKMGLEFIFGPMKITKPGNYSPGVSPSRESLSLGAVFLQGKRTLRWARFHPLFLTEIGL